MTGIIFLQPTARPTPHTPAPPPQFYPLFLAYLLHLWCHSCTHVISLLYLFHTTCCTPWTWRTLLCIVFTQRCWWLPLTPFQILISIQSLHCNVGLLIIDVPRIPLYPVFKYCIPPPPTNQWNKLILNSQQQNTR